MAVTVRWYFDIEVWDGMERQALRVYPHSVLVPEDGDEAEATAAFRQHYAHDRNPWTRYRLTGRDDDRGKRIKIRGAWISRDAAEVAA